MYLQLKSYKMHIRYRLAADTWLDREVVSSSVLSLEFNYTSTATTATPQLPHYREVVSSSVLSLEFNYTSTATLSGGGE
jgi:hypothetical protein